MLEGLMKILKKNKSGFTLVELLVSISLLAIIITAFTPLILFSYDTIYQSGQKRAQIFGDKGRIEADLADGQGDSSENIDLRLYDGSNVEKYHANVQVGVEREGDLQAAVTDALTTTMELVPAKIDRGYKAGERSITIKGLNIHFTDRSKFSFVVMSGSLETVLASSSSFTISALNDSTATFIVPANLEPGKLYYVKYDTVRVQLVINPSKLMAVGAGGYYIESDGLSYGGTGYWGPVLNIAGAGQLSDVDWDNQHYYISDKNGNISYIPLNSSGYAWSSVIRPSSQSKELNSVLFKDNKYYLAGGTNDNKGHIYESASLNGTWSNNKTTDKNLPNLKLFGFCKVNSTPTSFAMAANQIFYMGSDNRTWLPVTFEINDQGLKSNKKNDNTQQYNAGAFTDLAIGDNQNNQSFKAATTNGVILKSDNFMTWSYDASFSANVATDINGNKITSYTRPVNSPNPINSICYGNGIWVAVGTGRYTLVNTTGTWSASNVLPGTTTSSYPTLNEVIYYNNKFYAVGTNCSIYSSSDGLNWVKETTPASNVELFGIAGR